ncbi:MAG: SAM-dependent methyltransferase [Blautia sp.]|nr:SAM-dependent methyltransferase [Blautia sp.]
MQPRKSGCLLCGAPLVYLQGEVAMECEVCHKKAMSKTRCQEGHYICEECHMAGLDDILGLCLAEESKNPLEIIEKMMNLPFCHMHGPEHHVMVGAALLTAYANAGGELDKEAALKEMFGRGKKVPGGACGYWGACGAGLSTGMFVSIISSSTPLTKEPFALSHQMTAKSLSAIGEVGGPRCCKRDSYLSVLSAIRFVREHFGVEMEEGKVVCTRSGMNAQCIGRRCPFFAGGALEKEE